jgi:hypothetical protein
MDTSTCICCGRPFSAQSHPRWAFDREGRLLGAEHASHAQQEGKRHSHLTALPVREESAERAQFYLWLWTLQRPGEGPEDESDRWYAELLAEEPTRELSRSQWDRLAWWTDGLLKLGKERGRAIVREHDRLVDEFLAWRDGIGGIGYVPRASAAGASRCAW